VLLVVYPDAVVGVGVGLGDVTAAVVAAGVVEAVVPVKAVDAAEPLMKGWTVAAKPPTVRRPPDGFVT